MSFKNAVDKLDDDHAVTLSRPAVQFKRGDLTNANELLKNGCWQLPVDHFGHIIGDAWPTTGVVHAGGVVIESYLLDQIHIAALVYQKRWFTYSDGQADYSQGYVPGARSRFRIFGLVKELVELGYNEPVIVTLAGLNAKSLEEALKAFKSGVIVTASRIAKHKFPLYAFWAPFVPGPKEATRNNQYVTPPKLRLDGAIDEATLEKLYVGDDNLLTAQCFWDEAQAWLGAAEPGLQTNGQAQAKMSATDVYAPSDDNDEILVNDNQERVVI